MKHTAKLLILIICIALCTALLASCDGIGQIFGGLFGSESGNEEGNEEKPVVEEWTPKGDTITVLAPLVTSSYAPLFGEDADVTEDALLSLIDALAEMGLTGFPSDPAPVGDEIGEHELILGESDREASKRAKEYLDEVSASKPENLHWVFHYYDGSLAIIANCPEAYGKALEDLTGTLINDGKLSFGDTLKHHGTLSRRAYEKELEELEELKKEQRDALLAEIMPLYEAQRDEISRTNAFGKATANIGSPSWSAAPTTPIDEHPRVFITADNIPLIKERLKERNVTNARFYELLDTSHPGGGRLGEPKTNFDGRKGLHNYDKQLLELIQIKALGYLTEGHELYGYQAIYYIKNYLLTLDIQYISSDQCREYGNVMMTAALVYDWCYDLLTEEDKAQLLAGVETRTASGECGDPSYTSSAAYKKKMEVGFPPSGQGSVSGHGSEGQILRNYLVASIAFYDENPSWWNYVAARVYNDYVVTRNYYYQSGISQQGTGLYIGARHTADLFSAWLLKVGADDTPYVNLDKTIRSFLGYECAPDRIFTDGDGSYETRGTSYLAGMAHISAYLFGDAPLLAQAEHIIGKDGGFGADTSYLTSGLYVALRGISDVEAADDRYEGMELIQYNGHPVGQYIVRKEWYSDASAAVFMKIKERNTGNHEHEDAGTFEIYYKGMLTSDGGCYNSYGSEHTAMYHQATISHNGLIIFNPAKYDAESSDKTVKWYSGSQNMPGECSTLDKWLASETHETGRVTGRQHAYTDETRTTPLYAYIAGNITKAYPSDTVEHVERRMLTVYTGDEDYPMAFFVYDNVVSKSRNYEKRFLLQISSPDAPVIGESKRGLPTVTTENGEGKLVLTLLSDDSVINPVGGRNEGSYSSSKSQNYMINGKQNATSGNADDGHWGRIEIVWEDRTKSAVFTNLIYVTDRGNEKAPDVRAIFGASGVEGGVFNKSIVALFATERDRTSAGFSCDVPGNGDMSYYVSGVSAGSWTVTVDGETVGSFEASEEGGLLTFTAPAGSISIAPSVN